MKAPKNLYTICINLFAIFKMLVVLDDGTPFLISTYSSTVYLHHPCPLALKEDQPETCG